MMGKKQTHRMRNSRSQSASVETSFRRNASIASPSQRAAHEQRAAVLQRQNEQARHRMKRVRRMKIVAVALFVLACVAGLRMQIKTVQLEGVQKLSAQQQARYSEAIRVYSLENSFAQQAWTVDGAQAERFVLGTFPEVASARLKPAHLLNPSLRMELSFRSPQYVWKDASNQPKYIDSKGRLFSENLTSVDEASLIQIDDQSGIVIETGNAAVSQQTLSFIGGLQGELKPVYKGKKVLKRVIIPVSTREVRVVPEGESYYIKMSTERSLAEQVGELRSLLGFLRSKKITPKQYIDIRLEDKAFYR